MIDANMWAVGWTRNTRADGFREDVNGVTFLHTKRKKAVIGTAQTEEYRSTDEKRTRTNAQVYLTRVDKDEYLDICQIEHVQEQGCTGLDRGCQTYEHGETILTTIQTYNPRIHMFERYEMSKHPRCTSEFDFSRREGYLLLQTYGRIGFLPSPKSRSDEEDSADIF